MFFNIRTSKTADRSHFLLCFLLFIAWMNLHTSFLPEAVSQIRSKAPVIQGSDGRLVYTADSLGNRIPDFSWCGYMAGKESIPDAPVRIVVSPVQGDVTERIQSAIDYVASLSPDSNGIRGAVLLEKGIFSVNGSLHIHTSGVILRGCGAGEDGTLLSGTGKDRSTLIIIAGKDDLTKGPSFKISDGYVPVNATDVGTSLPGKFSPGDRIIISRPCTEKWIKDIRMNEFGGAIGLNRWNPGTRILYWDRTILAVNGNRIIFDAPLTTAIDEKYGGGFISKYKWAGRISNVGVENLCCVSGFDKSNPKDEEHPWMAVTMENITDAWVRQIVFRHFAGSAVALFESTKRITVEDCISLTPVSEIGGMRRNTFFTSGQQTLFQRCYSEYGCHDFAAGFCAAGPNAFVQCEARLPYSFSGSIDSWASGVLFDIVNIDGNALSLMNLGQAHKGAGWNAANSVLWQCTAARVDCYSPPHAVNWAIGTWGKFSGDGEWSESNNHVRPRSLYYGQLADRLGQHVLEKAWLLPVTNEACTSPTIEKAAEYAAKSSKPCPSLVDWIVKASERNPIPTKPAGIQFVNHIEQEKTQKDEALLPVEITGGRILFNGLVLTGGRIRNSYWRGDIRPYGIKASSVHITRFVPGRTGTGYTDDLNEVTDWMTGNHIAAFEHHYGLWYDRRRDDHEMIRRMDGDVWPPFYELPFARSGKETAWDGLSRYDLTAYNNWYWNRLGEFADLADQKGLLLIHQNYCQHNILEAGAHWADFPWRTANNINNTGFPEPPPYAGEKRIFMAGQFYDINHPVRREIHKAYIRKCLENFQDNHNVVQFISAEYTGPLSFTRFWIDVIIQWEKETGKNILTGISATKDVQDSILMDPIRSQMIDIIDIRYWQYREDGSLYAPEGGKNLAPRQYARLVNPGKISFQQVYRAVLEYRRKYPEKAVIYSGNKNDQFGWAVFMAGGSLANIPVVEDIGFLRDASQMKPVDLRLNADNQYIIGNDQIGYIIYCDSCRPVVTDRLSITGKHSIVYIDPKDGKIINNQMNITGSERIQVPASHDGPVVVWVKSH